ncbi:MAG: hypothetical protein KGV50_07845 [Gammaproteobacteria bacterium]|nr:hypothetical protein [Gammaproteobacteria bacterium]
MKLKRLSMAIMPMVLSTAVYAQAPQSLVEKPWLRDYMPSAITAYARIPNPKFYFTDTESPLQSMYQNPLYSQFMQLSIENILKLINQASVPAETKRLADVMLSKLISPIELMVSDYTKGSEPPTLVIAVKVDYEDGKALGEDLVALSKDTKLDIKPSTDNTGQIILKQAGVTAKYVFNPNNKRLVVALGAKANTFTDLINADSKNANSPISVAESQIDQNGNGLFVWLHPNPAILKQLPIPSYNRKTIDTLKVDQAEFLAAGFGLGDHRPKLKAIVKMPEIGLRKLFPSHEKTADPEYFGHLSWVFSLGLPNEEQLDNIAKIITGENSPQYSQYLAKKQNFTSQSGIDFSSLMKLIGNQVVMFKDDNGKFLAVPADAEAALKDVLSQLVKKGIPLIQNTIEIDGQTIHHVSFHEVSSQLTKQQNQHLSMQQKMLMPIFSQLYLPSNHIYWVKENDSLIFSFLPQRLIARKKGNVKGKISEWLASQKLTISGSTWSSAMTFRNLPQESYYGHLSLLQTISDMSDTPLNIEKFPTANTMSLPRYGSLALQIHNRDDMLSIEYSAENGLSDILFAVDNNAMIAMTGILAAIAVPSYQDYMKRAKAAQRKVAEEAVKEVEKAAKEATP